MKPKKILVLYTGGTFGMESGPKAGLIVPHLTSPQLKKNLKTRVPEMTKIASCDVKVLFNLDSCQMQPHHWFELANTIHQNQNHYDGVVVLHGTDTLAYTAAALSLLLSPVAIPVIITGAQKPLAHSRSDARQNFISALEVAAHAPRSLQNRVMVLFHDELFLGSRVRKKSAVDFAAFESPRFPVLATIGSSIVYHEIVEQLPQLKKPQINATVLKTLFAVIQKEAKQSTAKFPQILRTEVNPGFFLDWLKQASGPSLLGQLDAILLTLYASGTAPTKQPHFLDFLKNAQAQGCPVFAITEREHHIPNLREYSAGRELMKEKIIWCHDLTPEAAFVKLWLLIFLNQCPTRKEFMAWLQQNWALAISDECVSK